MTVKEQAVEASVRWRTLIVALLCLSSAGSATISTANQQASPVAGGERWWNDTVCYEIFVRSFVDSDGNGFGDLDGLTSRLDYLNDGDPRTDRDLGVTCVWLMPVFQATSYHGYDVENYYAIEPDYGTMADFDRFLEAAHQRGIRVMLDLVLNHTSVEHPWFQAALADPRSPYRDWYIFVDENPGYGGPSGQDVWHDAPSGDGIYYGLFWEGMPDLDFNNPAVTAEAVSISRFWLDKGVDGFRLDAIKHLIENERVQENTPETHEWLRDYRGFLDSEYPNALTIGEIFNAGSSTLEPYYPDQLHAYFQFEMAGQLLIAPVQGIGDGLEYVFNDAIERQPGAPWATFLTNHDQNRAMTVLDGDVAQAKLAAFALLTLPGIPFIYYGEELGMTGVKPDERIRTPMQWQPVPRGGFTSGDPWEPLQDDVETINVATQDGDSSSLLSHYRTLIHLRMAHPALGRGDFIALDSSDRAVLAFLRTTPGETVLVLINFGDEPVTDLTLTLKSGPLSGGAHAVNSLIGEQAGRSMTVAVDGSITNYEPGFTLEAQSGYLFALNQ